MLEASFRTVLWPDTYHHSNGGARGRERALAWILEGGRPKPFVMLGAEKSSISLFSTIPVSVIKLDS